MLGTDVFWTYVITIRTRAVESGDFSCPDEIKKWLHRGIKCDSPASCDKAQGGVAAFIPSSLESLHKSPYSTVRGLLFIHIEFSKGIVACIYCRQRLHLYPQWAVRPIGRTDCLLPTRSKRANLLLYGAYAAFFSKPTRSRVNETCKVLMPGISFVARESQRSIPRQEAYKDNQYCYYKTTL